MEVGAEYGGLIKVRGRLVEAEAGKQGSEERWGGLESAGRAGVSARPCSAHLSSRLSFGLQFPGGNDNYLTITGPSHPFLSGAETFHIPSLGDEEFEIPPLDSDPSLAVSDVVGHFDDLADPSSSQDGSFSAQYGVQTLDMPVGMTHGLMEQGGGLLSRGLTMDLDHSIGTQYSANPPVTIDVLA